MADTRIAEVQLPNGKVAQFEVDASILPGDVEKAALDWYNEQPSRDRAAGASLPGWARGLHSVLQGPTFGFYDEMFGGAGAAALAATDALGLTKTGNSFSENYRSARDQSRGAAQSEQDASPWTTGITRTAASMGVPVGGVLNTPRAVATQAPSVAGTLGNTAWQGFKYGAINGAGSSDADNAEGVIRDTLVGGGTGATLAPALQVTGKVLGAASRPIRYPIADRFGKEASSGGNWFQQGLFSLGAGDEARAKVAQALARDYAATDPNVKSGSQAATPYILRELDKLTPRAPLAAAGDRNTISLLDTVSQMPGETGPALAKAQRELQASRGPRLVSAADNALGTQGAQYQQTVDALDRIRKQTAAPFYDALDNVSVKIDDDLFKLLQKTDIAHRGAESLYKQRTGLPIDLTKLKPGDDVPFRVLDDVKQALYAHADSLKAQGNGKLAIYADSNRADLVRKLESLSPQTQDGGNIYRLARDAYAGPSELKNAVELGATAMTGNKMDLSKELAGMTQSEVDAFKVGALQALRDKVGTQSGQTSILKFWMEPSTKERLKLIFGEKVDFQTFQKALAAEGRLDPFIRAGKGSQTFGRFASEADLDVSPGMSLAANAATGNKVGAAKSVVQMIGDRAAMPEAVRDQIGNILLSRGRSAQTNIRAMDDYIQRIGAIRALENQSYGGGAAQVAPSLWNLLMGGK